MMVNNKLIVNLLLFLIMIIAFIIYHFQSRKQNIKEDFYTTTTPRSSFLNDQNLPNIKLRDCSVYFVNPSQEDYCDTYIDFYNMTDVELKQYILKNPNHQGIQNLRDILDSKINGTETCKLTYNGWKEIASYTDSNKTYFYPKKNINNSSNIVNSDIMNICFLDNDVENRITYNESVVQSRDTFSKDTIEFANLSRSSIWNSICTNDSIKGTDNMFENTKYFIELECDYRQNSGDKIILKNIKFKKGNNNMIVDATHEEYIKQIQPFINTTGKIAYQNNSLKWIPVSLQVGTRVFHSNICNKMESKDYVNIPNFSLQDLNNISFSKNIPVTFAQEIIDKLNNIQGIPYSNTIVEKIDETIKIKENDIINKRSSIDKYTSDINSIISRYTRPTLQVATSKISNDSNINQIYNLRNVTDNLILSYKNKLTNIHLNKLNSDFNIEAENIQATQIANNLNNAINNEYTNTIRLTGLMYQNYINEINRSFSAGYYNLVSYYNNNDKIKSTRELSNHIKCQVASTTKNNSNIYVLEKIGNIVLAPGKYNFYLDKGNTNDVETVDAFISKTINNSTRFYQKVAELFDNNVEIVNYDLTNNKHITFVKKIIPKRLSISIKNNSPTNNPHNYFELLGLNDDNNWDVLLHEKSINYKITSDEKIGLQTCVENTGLQAWYKFDKNLYDSSGRDIALKHWHKSNYFSFKEEGKAGQYIAVIHNGHLYYDGDNIDFNNNFSVCFWIKRRSSGEQYTVVGYGNESTTSKALHIGFRYTNQIMFAFWGDDLNTSESYKDDVNNWVHLSFTYNKNTRNRIIYRNGVKIANDTSMYVPQFASKSFKVGVQTHHSNISAELKDLRIYNTCIDNYIVECIYKKFTVNNNILVDNNDIVFKYEKEIAQIVSPFVETNPPQFSPLLHFKFDGNFNNSGNDENIKVSQGTEGTGKEIGFKNYNNEKVLHFDGNGYLKIQTNESGSLQNLQVSNFDGFTLSTWFKMAVTEHYTRIIDFGNSSSSNNLVISRQGTSNKMIMHIFDGITSYHVSTTNDCISNSWVHLTVTIQKSNAKCNIYINGVNQELIYHKGIMIWPKSIGSGGACYIGYSHWGQHDPVFKGYMKDFRIYNSVVSQDYIVKNILGGITKYPPIPHIGSNPGYFVKWSSILDGLPDHTILFNGVNKYEVGNHTEVGTYNPDTGLAMRMDRYIKKDYVGEWISIKMPSRMYLHHVKLFQREQLEMRSPIDYKIYGGVSNDKGVVEEWNEVLHEINAQYINHEHISETILAKISYDTYAICVNRIGRGGNAYILNFDEIEYWGSAYKYETIEMKKYSTYKIVLSNNMSVNDKIKIELGASSLSGKSTKTPLDITDINGGYYGIYIRYLCKSDKNIANVPKLKYVFSTKTRSDNNLMNMDTSYDDNGYNYVSNDFLKQSFINADDNIKKMKTITDKSIIFPPKNGKTSCSLEESVDPKLTMNNFYINCPSMPKSITLASGNKPSITHTIIEKPGLINVGNNNYPNDTKLKDIVSKLKIFRNINLEGFNCGIVRNADTSLSLDNDATISDIASSSSISAIGALNSQRIEITSNINVINTEIINTSNIVNQYNDQKNIILQESHKDFGKNIKLNDINIELNYDKYIYSLSKINDKYYIYLSVDNTLGVYST